MLQPNTPSKKTIRGISEDTEVLTHQGFVKVSDVSSNTKVLQYHEGGTVSFTRPICKPTELRHPLAIHINNLNNKIDQVITPDHRIPYLHCINGRGRNYRFATTSYTESALRENDKFILIGQPPTPELPSPVTSTEIIKLISSSINTKIYQTLHTSYMVGISGYRKEELEIILQAIELNNLDLIKIEPMKFYKKEGFTVIVIIPKQLFPGDLSWIQLENVSTNWCYHFMDIYKTFRRSTHAQSTWAAPSGKIYVKNKTTQSFSSKATADILQSVAYLAGIKTSTIVLPPDHKYKQSGFLLSMPNTDRSQIVRYKNTRMQCMEYDGFFYDIRVPSGFLVIRRNNVMSVTGG